MIKSTKSNLSSIERILKDADYSIRYEKGNFQSGYCLVKDRKIIVINRFFDIEARISCLVDILQNNALDLHSISDENKKIIEQLRRMESAQGKLVA